MNNYELRDVYETHIREHMLGPGFTKEIISRNPDEEILDKNPLKIYSTGIIYPYDQTQNDNEDGDSQDEEINDEEYTGEENIDDNATEEDGDSDESYGPSDHKDVIDDRPFWLAHHFGLVTCVPIAAKEIKVKISYAKYKKVEANERSRVKVIIGKHHKLDRFDELLNKYDGAQEVQEELSKCDLDVPFSNLIDVDRDNRTICLNNHYVNKAVRLNASSFLHINREEGSDLHQLNSYLRMLFGDFYQRQAYCSEKTVDVTNECNSKEPLQEFTGIDDIFVHKTVSCKRDKKYIKILVHNKNIVNRRAQWTATLFQPEIIITPVDSHLVSYTEPIQIANDAENNNIEFTYRDVLNYGKGVQCAVEWDDDTSIRTSFMPKSDVKKFSSILDAVKDRDYCMRIGVDANAINECCRLINLSHWQDDKEAFFQRLNQFVDGYASWCSLQQREAGELGNSTEATNIIDNQQELLNRLRDNITYLRENDEAFECFKWANTAMLIQMTIARNETFKKNRDNVGAIPETLEWFRENGNNCYYYPFQLAFLLMNVKSTFEPNDQYRNEVVDLIWFPTGGGKTEAYLALTALTIIARRRSSTDERVTGGIAVMMRYTLRLLTSQQFERASYLICALEFLRRRTNRNVRLGDRNITIGLWIGNNQERNLQTNNKWGRFLRKEAAERVKGHNPFPITYCPWCGQKLVTDNALGYQNDGQVQCLNHYCLFHDDPGIPVEFVTERVETTMPTLLFATVDKLAGLRNASAARMFGYNDAQRRPIDLIIQDELHLISGPLGSMVGFFENVVEKISTRNGRRPKIIASTATTRNTESLIRNLYNQREVRVFPAQGLTYKDNFFSHLETNSLRRHIGICMQRDPVQSEVRLVAQMLLARLKVIREELINMGVDLSNRQAVYDAICNDGTLVKNLDSFWTQVLYYNSLKDLGRMHSRIGQEVEQALHALLRYVQIPDSLRFVITGIYARVKEFTSREDSSRIKDLLTQAETAANIDTENNKVRGNTIDLVLASNMISVGIDINRWNVMMMSGQPRSISEYIQSSSRVGRSNPGLVINEYSPMRIREASMFENFTSFHAAYYKYVEPLSATPVTMQTLNHPVFNNVIYCYKNYFSFSNGMTEEDAQELLLDDLMNRYHLSPELEDIARNLIESKWNDNTLKYAASLRDIDPDCYTSIEQLNYRRR